MLKVRKFTNKGIDNYSFSKNKKRMKEIERAEEKNQIVHATERSSHGTRKEDERTVRNYENLSLNEKKDLDVLKKSSVPSLLCER